MSVIRNSELPRSSIPGLEHRTLAGSANGLENLSIWKQTIAPGGGTPPHRHDCEEVVLVSEGEGEFRLDGKVHHFGPDTTIVIPRNVTHEIINVGDKPMELVGVLAASPVDIFFPDGQPIEPPWET
jgi:quercetin dioxygenase-like cupin family protein